MVLGLLLVVADAQGASSVRPAVQGGSMEEERGGWWIAGSEGAEVTVGETIRVRLDAGTAVRILRHTTRLWLDPESRHVIHTLVARQGRMEVDVVPASDRKKEGLLVRSAQTPFGIVKRGSATLVGHGKEWALATSVGEVLLYKDRGWRELPEWAFQEFRDGSGVQGNPRSLPNAPGVSQTCRPSVVIGSSPTRCSVRWTTIAAVRSYRVEMRTAEGAVRKQDVTGTSAAFDVPAGRYAAVVRSVGPFGLLGPDSKPAVANVLGFSLPPGAYVDGRGDLRLPVGARVTVPQIEGLMIAYGRGDTWTHAPADVGLLRNEPTLVRFRTAAATSEYALRLVPRSIRAKVSVGPRTAVWPHDRVVATVRLVDERGESVPDWLEPEIHVSVGVQRLEAKWKRVGSEYRAVIPPPTRTPGPWVVRIDVRDSLGAPLGYDFLEVARARPRPARPARSDLRAARP